MADTGFKFPASSATCVAGNWTNPDNALASDNVDAVATPAQIQGFKNFAFGIPAGSTIIGIECRSEAQAKGGGGDKSTFSMSTDNCGGFTVEKEGGNHSASADEFQTLGNPTDLWGRSWVVADFNDGTFICKMEKTGAGSDGLDVDSVSVKVFFDPPELSVKRLGVTLHA